MVGGAQLVGVPFAHADVEGFAGADDVGEGLHRLLQRSLVVVAVSLVEVDVVGAEPAQ